MKDPLVSGVVKMIAAMALSATIGVFVIEAQAPALTVVFFRCLFGVVALAAAWFVLGQPGRSALTRSKFVAIVLGGVCLVLNWAALFEAFRHASIGAVTVIYHTQPFILLLGGVVFLGDKIDASKIAWIASAFAGLWLAADRPFLHDESVGAAGLGFALAAASLYAGATLFVKRGAKEVPPLLISLVQVAVGSLLLAPFAAWGDLPTEFRQWTALISLGVVHTGVMYLLLYGAVAALPTARIAVLSFVYPVLAIVVDFVVYGRALTVWQFLGFAFIVLASLAVNRGWRFPLSPAPAKEAA